MIRLSGKLVNADTYTGDQGNLTLHCIHAQRQPPPPQRNNCQGADFY